MRERGALVNLLVFAYHRDGAGEGRWVNMVFWFGSGFLTYYRHGCGGGGKSCVRGGRVDGGVDGWKGCGRLVFMHVSWGTALHHSIYLTHSFIHNKN